MDHDCKGCSSNTHFKEKSFAICLILEVSQLQIRNGLVNDSVTLWLPKVINMH